MTPKIQEFGGVLSGDAARDQFRLRICTTLVECLGSRYPAHASIGIRRLVIASGYSPELLTEVAEQFGVSERSVQTRFKKANSELHKTWRNVS
jgi:hypothetical protein